MLLLRRPTLRRERDTWWTYAIAVAGALGAFATALALLARTVDWTWQPAITAAAFAHQVLWASPVPLVLLVAVRRWYSATLAVVLLVQAVLSQAPLGHGWADASEHAGAGFLPTYPTDRFTGPLIATDHDEAPGRQIPR